MSGEKRRMGIEWVEIIEPRTRDYMYANLATGECVWDPPEGVEIKRSDDNQWWELFDVNTRRFYYYNVASHTTVWHRPLNSDIIPLAKLQCLKQFSGDFGDQRRPEGIPSQSSQTKKKSYSSASGEFDATYENQQTLDRNSKCAHRKQVSESGASGTGCRSLRMTSSSRHQCLPSESSSAHNVPYTIGATSSDYEHRLEQDLSPNYPYAAGSTSGSGVPVHSTSTPQLKKKYNQQASTPSSGYSGGRGDGMASLKQNRNNSDVEHNSGASITRSGSFVSSPHAQQPKMALRNTRNPNARDLLGGGGGINSDDDSMHEKYFKSVENTPQSRRRNTTTGPNICSHSKHSSDSSPQSPHGGGVQQQAKVSSKSGRSTNNNNIGGDSTSTNRSSRAGGSGSRHKLVDDDGRDLMEKPEKYLDKMLLHRDKSNSSGGGADGASGGSGGRHLHAQMKLPLNVEPQFVSKTATITSQSQNNTMGSLSHRQTGTNSRISPKCVSPGSQELSLSKSNLDRHNRDMAQSEGQLKLKKRSPANTGVKAMTPKSSKPPPTAAKHRETRTNTYASDVDYDAGNMSPLYSNWDQEHLLPLQHYIIEQAKLSKYNRYYAANTDDSVDSDSLHSDSQSEHSLSGHEPDNEDSDHSESRGDYLTYHQHYMAEDADQSKQNYYNVFDKNGKEDFRSSEVEAQLESVRDNLYSPVQNNQFFNPVGQPVPVLGGVHAPQPPMLHHSQSMVDGAGGPMASAMAGQQHNTQSRLSPMRQLQRSLQTHAQPNLAAHIPPPLPTGPSATMAALKFFNEAEYPNQPIYGTQFGPVAPLAIMKETDIEKFAQDNLNLHAKGIFRKKSSVRDMLSWTADAISRPMLALARDKAGKKIAIEMFKLVQIYMGDRKARQGMSLNSVAIDIITLGVMQPALRDELYVQLCRQTTENPSRESMIRGWELMAICLSFLSPSPTFQPALLNYMNRHHDPTFATSFPEFGKWPIHVQVSHYAKVACKRLERIGSSGKRPTKKPSEDEVNQSRMQIFRDSMFGNTLEEVMQLQRERFPNRQLPWVQVMLSEQVVMMGGKETEGIFRVPADLDEIGMVKTRLDQWEIPDIPSMDAHTPACLLKLWYRELYDPLIPDDLYEECIQTDDPAMVTKIVEKLSPINRLVLTYLIHFLQEFSQPDVVSNTKMDSSNLAMVFAPNCLRCNSQDPKVILENTRKEMAFLRTLITTMDTKHVKNML